MNWIIEVVVGVVTGLAYFGGLWLTVRRVVSGGRRTGFMLISLVLRTALFGLVFWVVSRQGAGEAMAAFGGFWIARCVLLARLKEGSNGRQRRSL
jgi:F1F0 ATPase subunit 2